MKGRKVPICKSYFKCSFVRRPSGESFRPLDSHPGPPGGYSDTWMVNLDHEPVYPVDLAGWGASGPLTMESNFSKCLA